MAATKLNSVTQSVGHSLKTLTGNTVHVKIHPRPRNLAESREVLRVLQQYGEVVMYKHLKYEPESPAHNTALAIYQNTGSADNLINASPLRFKLVTGKPGSTILNLTSSTSDLNNGVKRRRASSIVEQESRQLGSENVVSGELHPGTGIRSLSQDSVLAVNAFQSLVDNDRCDYPISAARLRQDKPPKQSSPHRQPQQFTRNPPPISSPSLFADIPITPPPQRVSKPTTPEFREFQLKISRSYTNHQAYIERQGYYGGFNMDMSTIMAEDLQERVPLEGMADCQLKKPGVALWVKDMKKDRLGKKRPTLRQMWEEGRRKRGDL